MLLAMPTEHFHFQNFHSLLNIRDPDFVSVSLGVEAKVDFAMTYIGLKDGLKLFEVEEPLDVAKAVDANLMIKASEQFSDVLSIGPMINAFIEHSIIRNEVDNFISEVMLANSS